MKAFTTNAAPALPNLQKAEAYLRLSNSNTWLSALVDVIVALSERDGPRELAQQPEVVEAIFQSSLADFAQTCECTRQLVSEYPELFKPGASWPEKRNGSLRPDLRFS